MLFKRHLNNKNFKHQLFSYGCWRFAVSERAHNPSIVDKRSRQLVLENKALDFAIDFMSKIALNNNRKTSVTQWTFRPWGALKHIPRQSRCPKSMFLVHVTQMVPHVIQMVYQAVPNVARRHQATWHVAAKSAPKRDTSPPSYVARRPTKVPKY